jgi:hypothetical protein
MKDLQEFRNLVEEEKSDYTKFDILVRAGLANKAQLARIHRILDKMTEERPQFNNADKEIVRNLFNRMVDLIANNKQVFQKTRQAVKEQLEEAIVDTSDYKIGPSGRKVRAHRLKIGDVGEVREDFELVEAPVDFDNDPPFVLVLKRRAIRMYPDKTKVALYYSKTLDKYFSVPYGGPMGAVVQAEETQIEEAVMDQLHKIVKEKQAQTVKFGNGQSKKVDHFTASAITQVHNALNDENKKKFADMVHKSPAHLVKASDFAFSRTK